MDFDSTTHYTNIKLLSAISLVVQTTWRNLGGNLGGSIHF